MWQYFSNNTNALNTINFSNNFTITDNRSDILAWLSPLDPKLRHQDIRDRRVDNVGEWFFQTQQFRSWYEGSGRSESDNAVLFSHGDPGVGKTFISSLVIDSLCDRARGQDVAVACFYFDFVSQNEEPATAVLGALLKQVVSGMKKVPEKIAQAYEDQKKVIGGRSPQLADIVKMLQITSSEKRTFICIDALDECAPGNRVKLLDSLNQIIWQSPGTRIFVTGRPQIQPEIRRRLAGKVTSISITPKRGDIIRYIHTRLGEDTDPDAMDSSLEADILKKIPDNISEIFLLVSLNIDAILQETTISRRRQQLGAMTDGSGLGDAYGTTLDRILGQGGEKARLGMAALMWISNSECPLMADELRHALAVKIGSPNLDTDNVPSIGTLLVACQGLVSIEKETSAVRFIHFTVQEYLRANPELFSSAHSAMAETCLSYLNSEQVKVLSTSLGVHLHDSDLQSTPFLQYSCLYWGRHARRELSECAKLLALKLFDDYNNRIPTRILLKAQDPDTDIDYKNLSLFSGLHCASFFGIVEIVASLVEIEGCDINQADCVGNTPLVWAARNGHEGVVKILLGRDDVSPDKPDDGGQTPLSWAARNGHEGVVGVLVGRDDVSPDEPDKFGGTSLSWAAWNGNQGVVKTLLGRGDVNPGKPDQDGWTPLFCAACRGHAEVVKLLLGRDDVSSDKPDESGRTPLWYASSFGHVGVIALLQPPEYTTSRTV